MVLALAQMLDLLGPCVHNNYSRTRLYAFSSLSRAIGLSERRVCMTSLVPRHEATSQPAIDARRLDQVLATPPPQGLANLASCDFLRVLCGFVFWSKKGDACKYLFSLPTSLKTLAVMQLEGPDLDAVHSSLDAPQYTTCS